eukprot:362150-Chlamydomonas_euryale.AAC.6
MLAKGFGLAPEKQAGCSERLSRAVPDPTPAASPLPRSRRRAGRSAQNSPGLDAGKRTSAPRPASHPSASRQPTHGGERMHSHCLANRCLSRLTRLRLGWRGGVHLPTGSLPQKLARVESGARVSSARLRVNGQRASFAQACASGSARWGGFTAQTASHHFRRPVENCLGLQGPQVVP